MERNTETLSTRDLASPNEPGADVKTSDGDVRDAATADGQSGLHDEAAPAEERTRLPVDQETQPPPMTGTWPRVTSRPDCPPTSRPRVLTRV
jgi:hypothetical protein